VLASREVSLARAAEDVEPLLGELGIAVLERA
jgi:hypothetical protein